MSIEQTRIWIRKTAQQLTGGLTVAVVEQQLPFQELDLPGYFFLCGGCSPDLLAIVDKVLGRGIVVAEDGGQLAELIDNTMVPHSSPPVFAIPGVRLPAVHDGMPEASLCRGQVLADPM